MARVEVPSRCDVLEVNSALEKAGFENKDPVHNDGRVIMEERHSGLKAELRCSTRKHLAPYCLEEVELKQERHRLGAFGVLYVPSTEYKRLNPITHSHLSIDTPVENRFEDALKRERSELTEGERLEGARSEAEEEKGKGTTPVEATTAGTYNPGTTRDLLQDLSEDE